MKTICILATLLILAATAYIIYTNYRVLYLGLMCDVTPIDEPWPESGDWIWHTKSPNVIYANCRGDL